MSQNPLRQSRAPLYLQVAEILRQRISRGIWSEGDLLPTIPVLAEEFGVAKITIRQAVKLLEQENLLEPLRGRGTKVLPRPADRRPLKVETRLADLVEMYRGDVPELVPLEDQAADLPADVAEGKPFSEGYHLIRRMHARDGQRYCVIALYFAMPIFLKYEARLRNELALPVLFTAPEVDVGSARQTLTINKCGIDTARYLGLSIGDPIADVRRVICDSQGRIVYLADVIYRGDYIRLDMDLLS